MTDNTHEFDDPVWTAYVLDELSPGERKALEEQVAADPAARNEVQTLRDTVALVFAALQTEPVGELTPEQRQRIRSAARRQLQSLAGTAPTRTSHGSPGGPLAARRRTTRGAVLLASLAMVAVVLVIVSVTPNSSPRPAVGLFDENGDGAFPERYLVFASRGLDASGTEHVDDYFMLSGELDATRLPRDAINGMPYVETVASPDQVSRRYYITPSPAPGGNVNGTWEGTVLLTDGSAPMPAERMPNDGVMLWGEPYGLEAKRHIASFQNGGATATPADPADGEGRLRLPGRFDMGSDVNGNGVADDGAYRRVPVPLRRSFAKSPGGQQQSEQQSQSGRQGQAGVAGGKPGDRGDATDAPAGITGPAQLTADKKRDDLRQKWMVVDGNEPGESAQSSPHAMPVRSNIVGRQPTGPIDNESGASQTRPDQSSQRQAGSLERTRREMGGRAYQGRFIAPPSEQQAGEADFAIPKGPPTSLSAKASSETSAAEVLGVRDKLTELEGLVEKEAHLRDEAAPVARLQQPGAQFSVEQHLKFFFDVDRQSSISKDNAAVVDGQELSKSVTFEKARFGYVHPRFSDDYAVNQETYAQIIERSFTPAVTQPVSTFSIDTDTASYSNVRRFLDHGQWPDPDAVRIEELVNYFPYNYQEPTDDHPVSVSVESAACPWQPEHRLARIALKAREIDDSRRPPTSLVFLVDVSGSMQNENKLPLAQQSLRMLTEELTENDRIAVVTYADEAHQVLDGTPGNRREEVLAAVDGLHANGSTNGAGGLTVAYDVARRHFIANGTNRVILCSDGDFNVGISDDDELVRLIEEERTSGVFLSICGFGTGNIKDAKLEKLADHGNGQYFYIDSIDEARKAFVEQLMGTLYTVAKDVKLQVDFNPLQVTSYRLVGYENRDLARQDFDNDSVDAGELGSGHTVTALYEYVPRVAADAAKAVTPAESTELSAAVHERSVRFGVQADGNVEVRRNKDSVMIVGEVYSEQRKAELATAVKAVFGSGSARRYDNRLKVVDRPEAEGGRVPFNDTLTVRLRYKLPAEQESTRLDVSLVDTGRQAAPSPDFEWASAVAAFGLLLRQSQYQELANFDAVLETAQAAKGDDPTGRRREFIDLVRQARNLYASRSSAPVEQPVALSSVEAYQKAAVAGKYTNLLDKVASPDDFGRYGGFHDYGRWAGTEYRGRKGLPSGYWVYVYPDWFIWGSESTAPAAAAEPAP